MGGLAEKAFGTGGSPPRSEGPEGDPHERSEGKRVNQLGHRREKVEDDLKGLGGQA